jgi:hypothetical protein
MFSRNAASSRAIPFAKMQEQLTAVPVRFGAANAGMQDKGEDHTVSVIGKKEYIFLRNGDEHVHVPFYSPEDAWNRAKADAMFWAKAFYEAKYHKQIYNRLTEPFQMMKTIVTATEFYNFFWLRCDGAVDPSLAELARCMFEEFNQSKPQVLKPDQWHLPYITYDTNKWHELAYYTDESKAVELNTTDAIIVSSARTAAVSFRNTDYDLEKSIQVHKRLVEDERIHGSAMEHQATPMDETCMGDMTRLGEPDVNAANNSDSWQHGVTHADRQGNLWSGNFKQWIQYRKTIKGENHDYI